MTAYAAIHNLVQNNQYDYSVKELEKDEFGRVLFSLTVTPRNNNSEYASYVVIMQGYTNGGVLYYEDVAYYAGDENEKNTALLKTTNDWNTPIDEAKTTIRRIHMEYPPGEGIYFGSTLNETGKSKPKMSWHDYTMIVCSALNINDSDYEVLISDYDESGKWLLCVNEKSNGRAKYFVLADETRVLSYIKNIEDEIIDNEIIFDIIDMKHSSGWNYSFKKKN